MKHVATSNITAITASSEDTNFPIENVLDDKPKRIWKASSGVSSALLEADVAEGCTDIIIGGTNADSASIIAIDPNIAEWDDGDSWDDGDEFSYSEVYVVGTAIQRSLSSSLWVELETEVDMAIALEITLSCPSGETLYAGVLHAGVSDDYDGANIKYNYSEGRKSFGAEFESNNGSFFYTPLYSVRIFGCTADMSIEAADRLLEYFEVYGKSGSGWRLVEGDNGRVLFGRMTKEPSAKRKNEYTQTVSFELQEVI